MISKVLKKGDLVIYESTVYPGCTEEDCIPVLETLSGLKFLEDFKHMDRYNCRVTCNYVVNHDNIYDISIIQKEIVELYNLEELRPKYLYPRVYIY